MRAELLYSLSPQHRAQLYVIRGGPLTRIVVVVVVAIALCLAALIFKRA